MARDRELAAPLADAKIDLVFCSGPLMRHLYDVLPVSRRGGYSESAAKLEPAVLEALAEGDVMMVKGSNGSRLGPVVRAIESRFPPQIAVPAE